MHSKSEENKQEGHVWDHSVGTKKHDNIELQQNLSKKHSKCEKKGKMILLWSF